jgi:hypothetical protein
MYQIFNKYVRHLTKYMLKRDYTSILADIPYGFQKKGCLHNNIVWEEQELGKMVWTAKFVTTTKEFWFIILHNVEQYAIVRSVVDKKCNTWYSNEC